MAERHVYWVQLRHGQGEHGKSFSLPFECDHESVEAIIAELTAKGLVSGCKLFLTNDGHGAKLITGRLDFAFGVIGLVAIQPYYCSVWEPEGTMAESAA